jgi:hypothetical protein
MSRFAFLLLTISFLSFLNVGCVVGDYFGDRFQDFSDVASCELYWGQGIQVNGRITKVAQMGLGAFDGDALKYNRRAVGVVEEMHAEAGVPLLYFTAYDRKVLRGNEEFVSRHEDPEHVAKLGKAHYNLTDPHDRGFYEVGAHLTAFVGVGASVDILQTLDFVLGWMLIDIGRDDTWSEDREPVANPRYEAIGDTPVSEEA